MRRWLILSLGLALVAGTAYFLLRAPQDEIDALSRARLEQLLLDAERQEAARP